MESVKRGYIPSDITEFGTGAELYVLSNVVTSDAIILDNCKSWFNLNRGIIEEAIPDAWILRLGLAPGLGGPAGYKPQIAGRRGAKWTQKDAKSL